MGQEFSDMYAGLCGGPTAEETAKAEEEASLVFICSLICKTKHLICVNFAMFMHYPYKIMIKQKKKKRLQNM